MSKDDPGTGLSSYQKGIQNLLTDIEKYEQLIWDYVLRVNSNFNSNEFPSTQIAKIIIDKLGLEKTKYPVLHKVIRIILKLWVERGICTLVTKSRSSSSKKTKEIYRFDENGIEKLKARFIDKTIDDISGEDQTVEGDAHVLKTRASIIEDLNLKLKDLV